MGRKKVETETRFDLRIRVDNALHEQIQEAAKGEHMTVAGFIRAAVVEKIKRIKREDDR